MTPEMASLLLRQHAALMDEGIGPEAEGPEDIDTLNEAWLLVKTLSVAPLRFTVHWGYENGFVESADHLAGCDCSAAKVWRGELKWCKGCQKHLPVEPAHECRAERAVVWITEQQGRGN